MVFFADMVKQTELFVELNGQPDPGADQDHIPGPQPGIDYDFLKHKRAFSICKTNEYFRKEKEIYREDAKSQFPEISIS
jgi:hypothetical protein